MVPHGDISRKERIMRVLLILLWVNDNLNWEVLNLNFDVDEAELIGSALHAPEFFERNLPDST
jgi:hypothetical protein